MEFEYPWQFESRRSAVMAEGGMVATSHPLAAGTGLSVLRDGGNAADAAVATAAVLNVVEPHMTGIGGDMFAMTHFDGTIRGLNGSGTAPADGSLEDVREATDATAEDGGPIVPAEGGLPVTAPGALDGWEKLRAEYGTRDLAELLQPAIEYAREGVPVTEYVARQWAQQTDLLAKTDASAETFLLDGEAPDPGQRFANPALAETFETIAEEGPRTLYAGALADEIVETVQDAGGFLGPHDLQAHSGRWVDPISTTYRGVEVLELPPNGQGAVALEALNVAEATDVGADLTDPDRLHHLIEATKIAFADGTAFITDPVREAVPVEAMTSKAYAETRAGSIDSGAAGTYPARAHMHGDTVYLTVVDGDGNAVSFINSVYMAFGSGLSVGGFALQNRGHAFSLDPNHANAIAPGKRTYHTLIPAMLREDGAFRASFGVMGGSMQPQGHLQVVAAMVDADLNPQSALDAPRFRWLRDDEVAIETGRVPDETVADLRDRGHDVLAEDEFFDRGGHWGGGQVIYRTDEGTLIGGSDPRRDGQAVGY